MGRQPDWCRANADLLSLAVGQGFYWSVRLNDSSTFNDQIYSSNEVDDNDDSL